MVLGERNVSKIILIGNDNIYRGKNVLNSHGHGKKDEYSCNFQRFLPSTMVLVAFNSSFRNLLNDKDSISLMPHAVELKSKFIKPYLSWLMLLFHFS